MLLAEKCCLAQPHLAAVTSCFVPRESYLNTLWERIGREKLNVLLEVRTLLAYSLHYQLCSYGSEVIFKHSEQVPSTP